MSENAPEATQDTTESAPQTVAAPEMAPENTGPTTSPDVMIIVTEDPGPAPDGDAPADDGTVTDAQPTDPPSNQPVVSVLEDNTNA